MSLNKITFQGNNLVEQCQRRAAEPSAKKYKEAKAKGVVFRYSLDGGGEEGEGGGNFGKSRYRKGENFCIFTGVQPEGVIWFQHKRL